MRLFLLVLASLLLCPFCARAGDEDEAGGDDASDFLQRMDVYYYYPTDHDLQSLKLRVVPSAWKEKGWADAKAYLYWQAPDKKACRIENAPKDAADRAEKAQTSMMDELDAVVRPPFADWTKAYVVKVSDDGDKTKLEATPKPGSPEAAGVKKWTLWVDAEWRLVREVREAQDGTTRSEPTWKKVEQGLILDAMKVTDASADGKETGSRTLHYEYEQREELTLLVRRKVDGGAKEGKEEVSFEEYEINPKLDADLFGKK